MPFEWNLDFDFTQRTPLGFKIKIKKKGKAIKSIRFRFINSSYAEKFVKANPSAILK